MNDVAALEVREARRDEWDAVGELCVAANVADGEVSERYQRILRDARARATTARLLVVPSADGLLGTVTWIPDGGPYAEIALSGEAEFRMLATAPAAQGRGVGEALVRACLERGQELELEQVVCSSAAWMRAAHRLYTRLGFVRNPSRAWSPVPGVDLDVFECPLAA